MSSYLRKGPVSITRSASGFTSLYASSYGSSSEQPTLLRLGRPLLRRFCASAAQHPVPGLAVWSIDQPSQPAALFRRRVCAPAVELLVPWHELRTVLSQPVE